MAMLEEHYPGAKLLDFNHGRSALLHLVRELGLSGKKIILPAYACRIFGELCRVEGLEPVFVDVDRDTFNLTERCVEAALDESVAAVVAIHTFGNPCDVGKLGRLRDDHGFLLIEDCAHALGATYNGRPVGSVGDVALISLYKTVPNIGGAALVINDYEIEVTPPPPPRRTGALDAALALNLLGAAELGVAKHLKGLVARHLRTSKSGAGIADERLMDITGCPGLSLALFTYGLQRSLGDVEQRRAVAARLLEAVNDLDGVRPQVVAPGSSRMNLAVTLDTHWDRDAVLRRMLQQGMVCDRIWHDPVIGDPDVQKRSGILPQDFPAATAIAKGVLNLPLSGDYTDEDVGAIATALANAMRAGGGR